jgi:uncharacterized protein (TIGR03067 family)
MAASLPTEVALTLALQKRLEDCWEEPTGPDTGVSADMKDLQGAWHSISGRREADLLVCGNRFAFRFADGEMYMGVFDLDGTTAPKAMDMRIDAGPVRHLGKTALCIYELQMHELRWCAVSPGRLGRLTAFPAEDDGQALYLVFRREQGA